MFHISNFSTWKKIAANSILISVDPSMTKEQNKTFLKVNYVQKIIDDYKDKFKIVLNINKENLGYQPNLQKVISIASGEFIWAIGDDDLLTPDALQVVENLFQKYNEVDFYYLNSFHLDYNYLKNFKQPFDTHNLPKNMPKLSKKKEEMECDFWDLVDHDVSFDFMLGNFLSALFRFV